MAEEVGHEEQQKALISSDLLHVDPESSYKKFLLKSDPVSMTSLSAKPKMYKVAASELMQQVKGFLPKIASANECLKGISDEERRTLDIEVVGEDTPFVEMSIALVEQEQLRDSSSSSDDSEDERDMSLQRLDNDSKNSYLSTEKPTRTLIEEVPSKTSENQTCNASTSV